MGLWKTLVICLGVVNNLVWMCEAREFNVGGNHKTSWQIPSPSDSFDKWAQRNRFLIGDSIVFKYDGKTDSVVEVSEADYKSCSKSNPIKLHNDGNTKITFDKSGLFYFISGADGHCHQAQKLVVRILAANHQHPPRSASAPAPTTHHHDDLIPPAPAPAPHKAAATPTLPLGFIGALALAFITALVY